MLDPELASHVLRLARRRGGSFAEIFAEERHSTSIRLDDGRVEELTSGLDRGAGVRVGKGTSYGYAYSNRLDREALERAAEAACAAIPNDDRTQVLGLSPDVPGSTHEALVPASSVPASEKVEWLRELDEVARSSSEEVRQVVGVYVDSVQKITIATSDGRWTEEERPRVRMVAQVVAARGDVIQTGFHGPAGLAGLEFLQSHPGSTTARIAAERAVTMLDSIPAPAGEMAVVLGPGCGGVLFHEACGHPLEADIVHREASVYRGRVG